MVWPILSRFTHWKVGEELPCASARVTSTDVTLLFHSLKLCFVIIRMTELHGISPVKRISGMPLCTVASRYKVKLGVRLYVHSLLKG